MSFERYIQKISDWFAGAALEIGRRRRDFKRRRMPLSLVVDAHEVARAHDWTSIRDVMQVRRGAGINQRRLFLQCLGSVVFIVCVALIAWIVYTGIIYLLARGYGPFK